jgi:hypothetical protein
MLAACVYYTEDEFFQNQWDYVLLNFGIEKVYVYVGDIEHFDISNDRWLKYHRPTKNIGFTLINSYSEIVEDRVFLNSLNSETMPGIINIENYKHPENACYIFGSDSGMFYSDLAGERVYIPSCSDLDMYSWVAAATVFYDRKLKNNG